MRKITRKISSKHTKMSHFETFLFLSKRVQIEFWVAEKIAIEQMNPNPKNGQNAQCQFFYIQKSREKVVFLAVLKKVENFILRDILSKKPLWAFKYVEKKLVIHTNLHPKYYWNRTKTQKNILISKWFIFFSTSQYGFW